MGSFYSTCSVTNTTLIGGQKVVRILLVPSAFIIENDGTHYDPNTPQESFQEMMKKTKEERDIFKSKWLVNVGAELNIPHFNPEVGYDSRNRYKEKGLICSNEGSLALFSPFGFPIRGKYYDYGKIEDIEKDKNVKALEEFFGLEIDDILEAASDDRWFSDGLKHLNESKKKENGDVYDKYILSYNQGFKAGMKNLLVLRYLTFMDVREEVYDYLVETSNDDIDSGYDIKGFNDFKNSMINILSKEKNIYGGPMRAYIPSLCKFNMFELLNLDISFVNDVMDQHKFIHSMNKLYKLLLPSNYGSQEHNYQRINNLNKFVSNLLSSDIEEELKMQKEYKEEDSKSRGKKRAKKIAGILKK